MNHKLATAAFLTLPLLVNAAEEAPEEPVYSGSAELGFLYKSGNVNSTDVKAGIDLKYNKDQWLSLLSVDLLTKKADVKGPDDSVSFETTDKKWTVTSQTNYNFGGSSKNYLYGNLWYEDSLTNSFENQSSISAGWGRHWYKTEDASFFADIGPGYKRDVLKAFTNDVPELVPSETKSAVIVQAQALYIRQINEHVEFKQFFSAKYAPQDGQNDVYKAETTLLTKLISTLQLKFTLTYDYNTEVEPGTKNQDVQTAATIVYGF